MSLILSGTNGLSDVDGSAATPAIRGTDTNTGMFFPAADTVGIATGGTERARVDSSGNLGLGVTPSASWTGSANLQIGAFGAAYSNSSLGAYDVSYNSIRTGSNTYVYAQSSLQATRFQQRDGAFNFFTAASGTAGNTISFTQAMTLDASGNLGVGTTSPLNKFHVAGSARISGVSAGSAALFIPAGDLTSDVSSGSFAVGNYGDSSSELRLSTRGFTTFRTGATDGTNGTERARIDSSGNFRINTTTNAYGGSEIFSVRTNDAGAGTTGAGIKGANAVTLGLWNSTTGSSTLIGFAAGSGGAGVGSITTNGSSTTAYNTSSDYRLKENIAPMTGALATVAQLKPCTYTWKVDGTAGQGFIAHELQAVVPDCVTGSKDAVETYIDDEGNEQTRPKYQGIDTSFLVATLTAALQELKTIVDAQAVEIAALKG